MGGFEPIQISIGLAVAMVVFFAGLFYWGNRFKAFRRTTIMAIGIIGGMLMIGAVYGLNHAAGWGPPGLVGLGLVAAGGLFVLAGATPAALGMLADISEEHPDQRGAIMGLYSVFLAVGQIVGSLTGGGAAEVLGMDGLLFVSLGLLVVALIPLRWLRGSEHLVGIRPGLATPASSLRPAAQRREHLAADAFETGGIGHPANAEDRHAARRPRRARRVARTKASRRLGLDVDRR